MESDIARSDPTTKYLTKLSILVTLEKKGFAVTQL